MNALYFKHYGSIKNNNRRKSFKKLQTAKTPLLDINTCIQSEHENCAANFHFTKFICENPEDTTKCKMEIQKNYLAIGILEEFNKTLRVFEKLLPGYFLNGLSVADELEKEFRETATLPYRQMSNESRDFLKHGFLKNECDIYQFVKSRFYEVYKKVMD